MRPADSPASGPLRPGGGSWCSDQAEDPLLDLTRTRLASSLPFFAIGSRRSSSSPTRRSRSRGGAGAVRARRARGLCAPRARAVCGRSTPRRSKRRSWAWALVSRSSSRSCRSRSRRRAHGRSGRRRPGSAPRARRSRRRRRRCRASRVSAWRTAASVWWTARVREALSRVRLCARVVLARGCGGCAAAFAAAVSRAALALGVLGSGVGGGHLGGVSFLPRRREERVVGSVRMPDALAAAANTCL